MHSRFRLFALLLFLGTALLFARSLEYGFLNYDDPDYVSENALVRGGLAWAGIERAFARPVMGNWHPLTMLSYMVDWELGEGNPALFHLSNVLWHATNAVLVFALLQALGISRGAALFCAAFFAWHPLRVESVVWISERKDVLSGFFFLVTILLYLRYLQRRRENVATWSLYWAAALCFALGLLCKPMLVTLPGVLLLVDFLLWQRDPARPSLSAAQQIRAAGGAVLEKLPFLVISLAFCLITLVTQQDAGASDRSRGLGERCGTALAALPQYLGKTFSPADLIPIYPLPAQVPRVLVAAGLLLLLVSLSLCAWQWRRRPWLAVGCLWFLGMLLPVLGLVQVGVQALADRYTYLPGLGLVLIAGFGADELGRRFAVHRAMTIGAGGLVALLALQTLAQEARWRDPITLWEYTLARPGENPMAHFSLGNAYIAEGRYAEAERELRAAVANSPRLQIAQTNLGVVLAIQGRPAEALARLEVAETLGAKSPKLYLNMARLLITLGRYDEAVAKCLVVNSRWPGLAAAEAMLAEANAKLVRPEAPGTKGGVVP